MLLRLVERHRQITEGLPAPVTNRTGSLAEAVDDDHGGMGHRSQALFAGVRSNPFRAKPGFLSIGVQDGLAEGRGFPDEAGQAED